MSKEYRFKIMAKMSPEHKSTAMYNNIIARNMSDAKNKFKERFPQAKIVSCVRCEERTTPSPQRASNQESSGSSLGGILLGAVATAGVGLAMSWLKKDKQ
ncbi:MAG: hypothetical protein Q4A60_03500 [Pasteurellaceae bacterium]|nr:hypothetical protein [Pasteurellaceae bacterium]